MPLEDVYEAIREDSAWHSLREPGVALVRGRGQEYGPLAMVVGDAPTALETVKRRPFCGINGAILDQLMKSAGLYAEASECIEANAFITSVVKYRLPGNRRPTVPEIQLGGKELRDEWKALDRPRLIVAVGAPARDAFGVEPGRAVNPGEWVAMPDGRTYLWVHYHPSFGVKHPKARPTMEKHWEVMGEWMRANGLS